MIIIELCSEKESSLEVEKERIFGTIRVFRGSNVVYVKVQCSLWLLKKVIFKSCAQCPRISFNKI